MHPAKSVIAFTVMSGAGYGLLIAAILGAHFEIVTLGSSAFFAAHILGFLLITSGLLSSTLHLGHPERAWRAISQWRTSWLSREGICALATFGPWALYIYAWCSAGESAALLPFAGGATVILALATIFTTSMIYRSLKAIPAWYNALVSPLYLVLGLTTGAVLLAVTLQCSGQFSATLGEMVIGGLGLSTLLKLAYWRSIDTQTPTTTMETATGLGFLGKVTAHDPPHTHDNYLLKEMGFKVAQKHSKKLRRICVWMWVIAALAMFLLVSGSSLPAFVLSFVIFIATTVGVLAERWLFFGEAKHVQALYYGH